MRASHSKPCMKASAFSSGSGLLLDSGSASARRWHQSRGRSQPQNTALPARGGKLLIGEADGDCLAVGFELKCLGHRLVIQACARRLRCFHLPPINPHSVAAFQLHGFGLMLSYKGAKATFRAWPASCESRILARLITSWIAPRPEGEFLSLPGRVTFDNRPWGGNTTAHEPDAKAIFPEPRIVQKTNFYQ